MPLDLTSDPTTEVIIGALDYFATYGWCQGKAVHGSDRCLFAALRHASSNQALLKAACERVATANGMLGVSVWNDTPGRTKQQVIEALENSL